MRDGKTGKPLCQPTLNAVRDPPVRVFISDHPVEASDVEKKLQEYVEKNHATLGCGKMWRHAGMGSLGGKNCAGPFCVWVRLYFGSKLKQVRAVKSYPDYDADKPFCKK